VKAWLGKLGLPGLRLVSFTLALCAFTNFAIAATCPIKKIRNEGNFLKFNSYVVELQNPDDPVSPSAWQGDMAITSPGGKQCSPGGSLIDQSFFLAGTHFLYIDTYNGSEHVQAMIDANNCAVKGTSPQYAGPPHFVSPDRFVYEVTNVAWGDSKNRSFAVIIGPDCLPGKPVEAP